MSTLNHQTHFDRRGAQHGFTLIELMVVVAIIGIIAAIAYPSYQEQVAKSRRADAQRSLMEAEQFMRRYFSARDTFTGATLPGMLQTSPRAGSGTTAYNIELLENGQVVNTTTALSATTFTIRATRTGNMAGDRCGDLTITNTGRKTLSGNTTGSTLADCFKAS